MTYPLSTLILPPVRRTESPSSIAHADLGFIDGENSYNTVIFLTQWDISYPTTSHR